MATKEELNPTTTSTTTIPELKPITSSFSVKEELKPVATGISTITPIATGISPKPVSPDASAQQTTSIKPLVSGRLAAPAPAPAPVRTLEQQRAAGEAAGRAASLASQSTTPKDDEMRRAASAANEAAKKASMTATSRPIAKVEEVVTPEQEAQARIQEIDQAPIKSQTPQEMIQEISEREQQKLQINANARAQSQMQAAMSRMKQEGIRGGAANSVLTQMAIANANGVSDALADIQMQEMQNILNIDLSEKAQEDAFNREANMSVFNSLAGDADAQIEFAKMMAQDPDASKFWTKLATNEAMQNSLREGAVFANFERNKAINQSISDRFKLIGDLADIDNVNAAIEEVNPLFDELFPPERLEVSAEAWKDSMDPSEFAQIISEMIGQPVGNINRVPAEMTQRAFKKNWMNERIEQARMSRLYDLSESAQTDPELIELVGDRAKQLFSHLVPVIANKENPLKQDTLAVRAISGPTEFGSKIFEPGHTDWDGNSYTGESYENRSLKTKNLDFMWNYMINNATDESQIPDRDDFYDMFGIAAQEKANAGVNYEELVQSGSKRLDEIGIEVSGLNSDGQVFSLKSWVDKMKQSTNSGVDDLSNLTKGEERVIEQFSDEDQKDIAKELIQKGQDFDFEKYAKEDPVFLQLTIDAIPPIQLAQSGIPLKKNQDVNIADDTFGLSSMLVAPGQKQTKYVIYDGQIYEIVGKERVGESGGPLFSPAKSKVKTTLRNISDPEASDIVKVTGTTTTDSFNKLYFQLLKDGWTEWQN